jgi:hypothetical protein
LREEVPMTRLILDPTMEARFANLKERVEVCDGSGRVLGVFTPAADHTLYQGIEVPFNEEEIRQAEEETESYTTKEVLAHLESLRCTPSDGSAPPATDNFVFVD